MYVHQKMLIPVVCILLQSGCASTKSTATEAENEPDAGTEEIAIGYGTQDPDKTATSVSSIDPEEANKIPVTNVEELLKGRTSGVRVINTPNGLAVRVRGQTSPYDQNEPLYVIDDMPVNPGPGGALLGLNPYDIESIEVLKGAAAAIYGHRAANGVVLIKTKRGK